MIIHHPGMPNNIAGTDRFVQWVARELSTKTYVSIMAQHHPMHEAFDHPKIARRITVAERRLALHWAQEAGLENPDP